MTVALTDAAASECADLRLVHAWPSVRTMGTTHTPMLVYNSQHARPKPLVVANVTLSNGVALPRVSRRALPWPTNRAGAPRFPVGVGARPVRHDAS